PFNLLPDLSNASVLGVGQMSGLLSGLVVRYPVILVSSGGNQYLLYPNGTPDLLTSVTGALNTTLTFYADGSIDGGGGFAPCFARGTMILTSLGEVAVENLTKGDLVHTVDKGLKPIQWIGSNKLSTTDLNNDEKLRPIRISKGALGNGLPSSELIVSPQHRILVRSNIAQKMFGTDEVLVAAKQLCQIDGIDIAEDLSDVEYFHFMFDHHEVVISNGAQTEALFTGREALHGVGAAAVEEILTILPQLRDAGYAPEPARTLASGRMGRKLAVRHAQNAKPLVQ
ncbi:MAG: Hint domain-containing protein, partial [Paracoccus sp. (in: a-proteobacteria)]|nr:Hint domain-containing protein [Paracoccus sp. (in: a-proteobacteria)]